MNKKINSEDKLDSLFFKKKSGAADPRGFGADVEYGVGGIHTLLSRDSRELSRGGDFGKAWTRGGTMQLTGRL